MEDFELKVPLSKHWDAGDLALHCSLALGAAAVLGLSVILSEQMLRGTGVELCRFYSWSSLPCPGCGLTRAFCAISDGEFGRAWELNPFSFLFYVGCVALLFWPFLRLARPGLQLRLTSSRAFVLAPLLLVAAMWVFGLCRIVTTLVDRGILNR